MSFLGELGRRNVIRVGIAYAIVSWLVVQVADIVLETIGAPEWVMQTLMLLLGLGFFVTLIFAWAYEVTPEGIKRESQIDRSASITHVTGRKLDRVIIGLLFAAALYFFWESRVADRPVDSESAANGAATVTEDEVLYTPPSEQSIAVLPFDNRSNRQEDEFFTEGMHDDLLTTLAKIGSMKVISRTSVMEYRDTTKKIPEIAAELGVANILEGGVQRAGNQVRINVQLIDADTDEHLWAEIYDRELTAENLFAIQSEISKAIADALHATLSPEEIDRIDAVPTNNLDAFDHYLRGRKHMATRAVDDLERATQEFLAAVDIDPGFALAWVGVADAHNLLVDYKGLPDRVFDNVRDDAINRALDLDPGLGEAYASLGSLLHDQGDFERAEEALRTAIRYSPNYSTSYHWLSHMLVRFPARAPEALPYAQRAMELDPNSAIILSNLAFSYLMLGDLDNAVRYFEQQIEAQPDFTVAYGGYSGTLRLLGDLAGAIEAQRKMIELDPDSVQTSWLLALNYASVGAFEEADAVSRSMQERFPDRGLTRAIGPVIALAKGENPPIRGAVTAALQNELSKEAGVWLGYVALLGDEFDLAYEAFRRVAPNELADETVSDDFLNWWLGALCELSWVLLETEGNEAFGKDVLDASIRMYETGFHEDVRNKERYGWSLCYLLAGDEETALDVLQRELDQNSAGSWPWQLKTPPYDAIRDDPRFLAMQSEFERRMAEQLAILRNASKRPAFEF